MTVKFKIIGVIVGGAVLAAGMAGIRYGIGCQSCGVRWLGYADADYVNISPTLAGRLTSLDVERGDEIAAGALLFSQDDIDDRAARDQAKATLLEATEKLADLNAPGRSKEISQALAEVSDARATYERFVRDLARAEYTAASGATSRQALDQLRTSTRSAAARLEAVQAKLDLIADTSGREHEIASGRRRNGGRIVGETERARMGGDRAEIGGDEAVLCGGFGRNLIWLAAVLR